MVSFRRPSWYELLRPGFMNWQVRPGEAEIRWWAEQFETTDKSGHDELFERIRLRYADWHPEWNQAGW